MEAKPDWWAVYEVAKRLGFQFGFDYEKASDIFNEHAALSGFENSGARDFDISAYASLSASQYNEIRPFQWPQPMSALGRTAEKNGRPVRFFESGQFYTHDRKARFVPVRLSASTAMRASRKVASADASKGVSMPLVLNTGRSRDQWHTMTRTGYVSRLSAHVGEPFIQINFEDARALGVEEATVVTVSSDKGGIIVRALVSDEVAMGNVFIPMHWSDEFTSNARVNVLMRTRTNPISGQPALKNQRVVVSPSDIGCYGVMLGRTKPANLNFLAYWATAPVDGGWKTEFASAHSPDTVKEQINARIHSGQVSFDTMEWSDSKAGEYNTCWSDGSTLVQAVYLAPEPVWAPRALISSFLTQRHESQSIGTQPCRRPVGRASAMTALWSAAACVWVKMQ